MTRLLAVLGVLALGGGLFLAAGCDGDDSTSAAPSGTATNGASETAALSLTGTWKGPISAASDTITMHISQNESILTGSYTDSSGDAGTLSGEVSDHHVELTLIGTLPVDYVAVLTGTVSDDGNEMDGTYEITEGGSGTGPWHVTRQ